MYLSAMPTICGAHAAPDKEGIHSTVRNTKQLISTSKLAAISYQTRTQCSRSFVAPDQTRLSDLLFRLVWGGRG